MRRGIPLIVVMALVMVLLAIPVVQATAVSKVEASGQSSSYRNINLTWELAGPAVEGDGFHIMFSKSPFANASNATLHSTVFTGPTTALAQPVLGEWYDDCQSSTGDGDWAMVFRGENGSAVVPAGTVAIQCDLTGMPAGVEVFLAIWSFDSHLISDDLSEVVTATSTAVDELPPDADTRPVWFAIGSIALSLVVLLAVLGWKERTAQGRSAMLYVAPALMALALLTFYPVGYGIVLSFTDANQSALGEQSFNGLDNYVEVFTSAGFLRVLGFTLLWTVVNVSAHVGIGLALAMALQGRVKGKVAYRTILLLPWAIPSYITVLIWRGIFQYDGLFNGLLGTQIDILGLPVPAAAAVIVVNIWLGFPFMMMTISGALQTIPGDIYEAAEVDGVSPISQFRHLTLPMLKPAIVPVALLGFIWTFNMFNVIYLMTDGGPNLWFGEPGSTDILITYVYDVAFRRGLYGVAAAWSVVIFLILLWFSATYMKKTNATEAVV